MSDSTWHFITPFPFFGWLFGNMVLPRFVSMWQGMFGRDMIADDCRWLFERWLELAYDGCFINTLQPHRSYQLHIRNCPGRIRAGDAFYYTDDAYCCLVTSALELWPSRSSHRHGAPSPSLRSPFTVRWPPLLPSSCRRADDLPAGRRGHVRTAVLPPWFSHATSVRCWPFRATFIPIII